MAIKCENEYLSKAMQSLMIRYVRYFNSKYNRIGTLIQNRFKSRCVEDQRYFLEVCRYIHRNPEKAKIMKTEDYEWSSYKEYIGKQEIVNTKILLYYFNNDIKEFIKYTTQFNDINDISDFAEYEIIDKLTDEQLRQIIIKKFDISEEIGIANFFKNRGQKYLENDIKIIKDIKGSYKTQVARVIRGNRKIIGDIWDKLECRTENPGKNRF